MSEGKLSSEGSVSDDQKSDDNESGGMSFRLGGRFRAPSSSADLSVYSPDEDDVVDEVAKRFRSGPNIGSAVLQTESLDSQQEEDEDIDEGFLLNVLDAPPAEDASIRPVPAAEAPELDEHTHTSRDLLDDTDRMDELPMVEVEPLSTDSGPQTGSMKRPVVCPSCRAENPAGMRFCVECGGALARKSPAKPGAGARGDTNFGAEPIIEVTRKPPPPSKAAKEENPWAIQLVSINEDGSDGTSVPLKYLETTVGREGDSRFPTDAFLSPKHARFHIEKGKLFIEDLYSLNGTFIKVRDETRLTPGDTILMGRQVLRFERFEQSITPKTKSSDGTRYMGSPAPGGSFKILQNGIGGIIQNVYCLPEAGAVLGREKGDIVFPHDKFMSGRHAQIYAGDDGHCYLVDLNSSNGTWIKIWEKTALDNKDYIFMGQQLFRVHYES